MNKIESAVICKVGGRKVNQDYYALGEQEKYYCFVVTDGLGGYKGSEEASKIAAVTFKETFLDKPIISIEKMISCLEEAQKAVIKAQTNNIELSLIRTTILAFITDGKEAIWAHVGDTRLYIFDENGIIFQTKDHSIPQKLVDIGELKESEIRFHEDRNKLLRVMGDSNAFRPVISDNKLKLRSGFSLLMCTDGFWEYILEDEMEKMRIDSQKPEEWLSLMEGLLLNKVKGSNDNYTAVAVFIN